MIYLIIYLLIGALLTFVYPLLFKEPYKSDEVLLAFSYSLVFWPLMVSAAIFMWVAKELNNRYTIFGRVKHLNIHNIFNVLYDKIYPDSNDRS